MMAVTAPTNKTNMSNTITSSTAGTSFCSLPYDVRHLIYQNLFPDVKSLYIQSSSERLQVYMAPDSNRIPTSLLRVSRAVYREASEYLYNTYLFNIVGVKQDCLATYSTFERTLRRHARHEVHVDMFSNGAHSQTMCVSLRAGDSRRQMLEERARGEKKELEEVRKEIVQAANQVWSDWIALVLGPWSSPMAWLALIAVLVALCAWILRDQGRCDQ